MLHLRPIVGTITAVFLVSLGLLTEKPIIVLCCIASVSLLFSILWFSRDPERTIPEGDNIILSAADGRVCSIQNVRENLYIGGEGLLVGVYLSLFDVHINRIPVAGVVRFLSYKHGTFFPAFREKASIHNEQQIIGIESNRGTIVMKQIAGSLARRIVCHLSIGEVVKAGDRFGKIKLGSRVELILPSQTELNVSIGERVKAGESIIGFLS